MAMSYLRHRRSQNFTLLNIAANTTVLLTTPNYGAAVSLSGYKEGVFVTRIAVNSTAAPRADLQAGIVPPEAPTTTYWGTPYFATLSADFTGTAHAEAVAIQVLPDWVRTVITAVGTSTEVQVAISCNVYA